MREMKDSGIAWIGAMPRAWKMNTIAQIFLQVKCKNTGLQEKNLLSLSYGKVKRKSIDTVEGLLPESFDGYNIIEKDDIVLRLTDLQNDHTSLRVGLAEERGIITSAYLTIRNRSNFCPKYLYYYLHSFDIAKGFYGMGAGVRQGLNWDGVKWLKILAPSVPEQERIAAFLDAECAEIDAVLEKTRASIEEYKKLKQAVITQVVTKGIRGDRPMKDSGIEWIGDIPESWEVSSVRYIGQLQNGISKGGEFFGKGFPFVSYGDVYKNYELPHSVSGLIDTTEDERATYSVEYGDIFFTRTSETIEEVGFSCVCKRSIPNATFAGFIIRLRPFCADEKILTDYAKYYFRGEHIRAYLVKEMNLVTRASLGQTLLKGMSVIVPPKSVQKEIAEYLDDKCADIDALVAKKQQYLTEIENYKKSLIYEYVTGKKEVKTSVLAD